MTSLALVGAVGGAGTTRTALELAAVLAREGRDVALLDAAYATQGLADRVERRIDPDVTELCVEDRPLDAGLLDLDWDAPGRVAACPARAPFARLARAKTADAARAFEHLVTEAGAEFDHVLVDTPPVAANQSVAAVSAADRVAVVAPATDRGAAALPRARDRLADLAVEEVLVVATRGDHEGADAAVPETSTDAPAALADDEFAAALADLAALVGADVGVDPSSGLL